VESAWEILKIRVLASDDGTPGFRRFVRFSKTSKRCTYVLSGASTFVSTSRTKEAIIRGMKCAARLSSQGETVYYLLPWFVWPSSSFAETTRMGMNGVSSASSKYEILQYDVDGCAETAWRYLKPSPGSSFLLLYHSSALCCFPKLLLWQNMVPRFCHAVFKKQELQTKWFCLCCHRITQRYNRTTNGLSICSSFQHKTRTNTTTVETALLLQHHNV
jgi:hypothetical protein